MNQDINALILAGGKSSRMGQDKSMLLYRGETFLNRTIEWCRSLGLDVYVSCRPGQDITLPQGVTPVYDTVADIGPMAGLLSAFTLAPDKTWLVLACDMPLLGEENLRLLLNERGKGHKMIALSTDRDALPEPLAAIYESDAYPAILENYSRNQFSLIKVLLYENAHKVIANNDIDIININTPEAYKNLPDADTADYFPKN